MPNLSLKLIKLLVPRPLRNWLRSPARTLQWLRETLQHVAGINPTVELRPGWHLKCHPEAARWFWQHQIADAEQRLELDRFIALAQPGMVFFDIGAHFGVFTLAALHYGGEKARAVAFDPSPAAVQMVRTQLAFSGHAVQRCEVIEAAVGDQVGKIDLVSTGPYSGGFYVPSNAGHAAADLSSAVLTTVDRKSEELGLIPTHIKIDVEGSELAVLRGGWKTLASPQPPILFLELHNDMVRREGGNPADASKFLKQMGYSLFTLDDQPITHADAILPGLLRLTARKNP